ncbi:MAG: YlbF family regulator [Tetragenococcus halophilus]|uniref:YlbF family regulator n=2 Tax=Tetragenococcus halophilus TaxID=51669 RepID=A0A2H6CKW2_TETHA|nr:YlbF family regulator [Tetragenococcus halophilus]MCO7026339.1 YlbF family regulator [Tetragenococcus halophilus]MCO8284023.1 YlbF family regulator [Tetragenococcus halophilus]MCO8285584.1 YlbF family regulator [Tetragenococcus halophilus]MCO8287948.1 YlbF family regulator [Tetragenococcus halophilus]MCO8292413.1 YlbF family regulator [Tetragenococcus halophilus]
MIYDEQLFAIEDQMDDLCEVLVKSATFQNYLRQKGLMYEDKNIRVLRDDFIAKKEDFETVAAYGKYAPDYRKKQLALRKAKRTLDLHPKVAEFRLAETDLQSVLDTIGSKVASTVSEGVKVDAGTPFFENNLGKGGNCDGG